MTWQHIGSLGRDVVKQALAMMPNEEERSVNYDNTNRGTLGKNERRESDRHPEYTGKLNVDGREYWLSAWVKQNDRGKFFSLAVKPKDAQPTVPRQAPAGRQDLDDEIPF
jgi:hypothetical protein